MKKRFLLLFILIMIVSAFTVACGGGEEAYLPPYEGVDQTKETVTIDQGVKIDGVLDEEMWQNNATTLSVNSKLGTGKMDVTCYFGESAIYVAFVVEDESLFYSTDRSMGNNTGVELYFAPVENYDFGIGCYYIRVVPTPMGSTGEAIYGYGATRWSEISNKGLFTSASTVEGTFNQGVGDDNGYIVETAISYKLWDERIDKMRVYAAFNQSTGGGRKTRDASTGLTGGHYLRVSTWSVIDQNGKIDATEILDEQVVADEYMTIDGVLNENVWTDAIENEKGKSFTYNDSIATLNGATYAIYTHLSDLGVYIGLDSTDKYVYANSDRAVKYDSGMELFVATKGVTKYDNKAVKQLRFSVGGRVQRFDAYSAASSLWVAGAFPLKSAGSVKNGQINSSNTDGWQGEIFVPWSSFGISDPLQKREVSILPIGVYHSTNVTATEGNEVGWKYVSPVGSAYYKDKSINIQETYLKFTKNDGFVYSGYSLTANDVDANNVEAVNGAQKYYFDVTAHYFNTIKNQAFTTEQVKSVVDEMTIDGEKMEFVDNGDGQYRVYLDADELDDFRSGKTLVTKNTTYGYTKKVNVTYDSNMVIDGAFTQADAIINEITNNGKRVLVTPSIGEAQCEIDLAVSIKDGTIYFSAKVKDGDLRLGSALSLYVSTDEYLDPSTALRLKIYANGAVEGYKFAYTSWEMSNSFIEKTKIAVGVTDDGYMVEGRILADAFFGGISEDVYVMPTLTFSTNVKKDNMMTALGRVQVQTKYELDPSNFMHFDANGFNPTNLYVVEDHVTFIQDRNMTGSDEQGYTGSAKVTLSYLPLAGLSSDSIVAVTLKTNAGEERPYELSVEKNGLTASVATVYAAPSIDTFDSDKVYAYFNFDNGAENLVASDYHEYLEVGTGTNFGVNPSEKGYEGDKSFNANMRTRWFRVPYECGNDSFTVSMNVNCDRLRSWPTSNYAFILFGTGNVDVLEEGFSVRMRGEFWQIRLPGIAYTTTVGMEKLYGFKRLTVSVERAYNATNFHVWLEDELLFVYKTNYSGPIDLPEYGKLGIGGPGSYKETTAYPNPTVAMDDIIIYKDIVYSAQDIYDMYAYADMMNEKAFFTSSLNDIAVNFNEFNDVEEVKTVFQITNGTGTVITDAVTFGGAWADLVSKNADGGYTFTMSKESASQFVSGQIGSYTYNGITKYVKIKYNDIDSLKTDAREYAYWTAGANDGKYAIDVTVTTIDGIPISSGNGVKFISADLLITDVKGGANGKYTLYLDKAKVDELDLAIISVCVDGKDITAYDFIVKKNELTSEEIASLQQNALAYLNFDGANGISNLLGGETAMVRDADTTDNYGIKDGNGGQYFQAGTENNTMAVKGINFGTGDFTISFDVKVDATSFDGTNASYELISSTTGTVDQHISTFQFSMLGTGDSVRIQVGRNDGQTFAHNKTVTSKNGGVKVGEWVRYTVVVDRNVGIVEGRTNVHKHYLADGSYSKDNNLGQAYLREEDATVSLYVDGKLFVTVTLELSGQVIGYDDQLYIGGNFAWGSKDLISGIDNLAVFSTALSAKQVEGLPSYYDALIPTVEQ